MTVRLSLLCCGATRTTRQGGFAPSNEPLDPAAWGAPAKHDRSIARVVASGSAAAAETARRIGVVAATEPRLDDQHAGDWTGRSLEALAAEQPEALAAWLAAPDDRAPGGGEAFTAVVDRVRAGLSDVASGGDRRVLAITHPMVVRAALCAAIGIPSPAAMRIDLAPLACATLSFNRGWRLQALGPTAGGDAA